MNYIRNALVILTLASSAALYSQTTAVQPGAELSYPKIEFAPPIWKYGMIAGGEIAKTRVEVRNRGEVPVMVTFVPTCTCLAVAPATQRINPGASADFALSFDSKDDIGITRRGYIVQTDLRGVKPLYYELSGVVRVDRPSPAPQLAGDKGGSVSTSGLAGGLQRDEDGALMLSYYYTPGCRSCEEFLNSAMPQFQERYGIKVAIDRRDLMGPKAYEELAAFAASIGATIHAIPALRFGNELLQGDAVIRERLPALLVASRTSGEVQWASPRSGIDGKDDRGRTGELADRASVSNLPVSVSLAAWPVMAAGLVDGINPCAFTTLIFLLASLALAGRGKREVLAIGALFSLGVFLSYLGIGFGLFAVLRAANTIAIVGTALRAVLCAVLVVFAGLSVFDYAKIRAGKASEMLLQLPTALKLRIHSSIRTRVKTVTLASSSLVLGFLVSVFEFACTGQVYLPTLAYLARSTGKGSAILLLVLYNVCFIAPLVAVFAASYFGVSSKRIALVFQRRMGAVKLGLAGVFIILAVLTLVA